MKHIVWFRVIVALVIPSLIIPLLATTAQTAYVEEEHCSADRSVIANFQTTYYTLTVEAIGYGVVYWYPNLPLYPCSTIVTLWAIPGPGWEFYCWGGDLGGSQNPDSIIMDANKYVSAYFLYTGVEDGEQGISSADHFAVTPNPSSGNVEMRYALQDGGQAISLKIYDIHGRLVRALNPTTPTNGQAASVIWDGRDTMGKIAPNGVYFVRFQAGDFRQTTKLMMIR